MNAFINKLTHKVNGETIPEKGGGRGGGGGGEREKRMLEDGGKQAINIRNKQVNKMGRKNDISPSTGLMWAKRCTYPTSMIGRVW